MEKNNKMNGVIIAIAAVLVVGGGVLWAMNSGGDDNNTDSAMQSQQDQSADPQPAGDIVEVASGTESLSTLVAAVQAADLVETLQSEGPFTVFAPTNAAFDKLPDGTLESLLEPANKDTLASILTYHVVSGRVLAADLSDGQTIATVQGEQLTVKINDSGVYIVDANGGEAIVTQADVSASNGVVHIIDSVLLFE